MSISTETGRNNYVQANILIPLISLTRLLNFNIYSILNLALFSSILFSFPRPPLTPWRRGSRP